MQHAVDRNIGLTNVQPPHPLLDAAAVLLSISIIFFPVPVGISAFAAAILYGRNSEALSRSVGQALIREAQSATTAKDRNSLSEKVECSFPPLYLTAHGTHLWDHFYYLAKYLSRRPWKALP